MKPTITAFRDSPDKGQGHARDMRVRWALEEVGQDYDVCLRTMTALKEPPHLALNPFGSIPTYQEGALTLFESGSIVLHVAERHPGLFPPDADGRARAITWIFAVLNTIEPPIVEREAFLLLERDKSWFKERLALLDDNVRKRLGELSAWLGERDWLDGNFSAGDLMMVMVLRRLEASNIPEARDLLSEFPTWRPMSRAAKRGQPIGGRSRRSGRWRTPAGRGRAAEGTCAGSRRRRPLH